MSCPFGAHFNVISFHFSCRNCLDHEILRKSCVRLHVRRVLLPEVRVYLRLRHHRCRMGLDPLHHGLRPYRPVQPGRPRNPLLHRIGGVLGVRRGGEIRLKRHLFIFSFFTIVFLIFKKSFSFL